NTNTQLFHYCLSDLDYSVRILLYSLIFLLSVFGNTLIIIVLILNKRLRTVTNSFLLSLALSDLMVALFCMPFTLIPNLLGDFIFGQAMCKTVAYFMEEDQFPHLRDQAGGGKGRVKGGRPALEERVERREICKEARVERMEPCKEARREACSGGEGGVEEGLLTRRGWTGRRPAWGARAEEWREYDDSWYRDTIPFLNGCLRAAPGISVSVSTFSLVAIAIERYSAICNPLKSRAWQTRSHAYRVIASTWILSLIIMIPYPVFSTLMAFPKANNSTGHNCRLMWPKDQVQQAW
ncbi:CCKAR protein, partial [Polyodon spathula]|nr:CCKAR protein [Polyodon spathula]